MSENEILLNINLKSNEMNASINHRLWLFFLFGIPILSINTLFAQGTSFKNAQEKLILAVNAYSFNDLLSARDKSNNEQVYTLFNLLDWCASKNIKAIDLTGYFFPTYPQVPSDEYIEKLRDRATQLGIAISGTGVRNNFASPDPSVRAAGIALAKEWIVVASKFHAPVIRLFAGEIPAGYEQKWDEVAGWTIECFKECAEYGKQYGVKIGIQNHGDMLQTAGQCLKVLKAIDSNWAGLIIDTGSFKTSDPYKDIELTAPYAINWQVKESPRGIGNKERTDFTRLIKIIKKQGYEGYLPVETLLVKGQTYDPFALVAEMLDKLKAAIDENTDNN
jgi:sugar phosphate isomerase/epimerase